MDNILKLHASGPSTCKECASRSTPIPGECPLWKLDPESMIKGFNSEEGMIHEGCPYVEEIDINKFIEAMPIFDWFKRSMDPVYIDSDNAIIKNLMEDINGGKL